MLYKKYKSYEFGSTNELSKTALDRLIPFFKKKHPEKKEAALTGRTAVIETDVPDMGAVIIKKYSRGGLVSYINKDKYFYSKKGRSEKEFQALTNAARAGVSVPQPLVSIKQGKVFYKAWLVTKKIKEAKNFATLCINDKNSALTFMPEISLNINRLIEASIFHVDLHPGNIVIDRDNRIYILDFDKANCSRKNKTPLKKKYIQRWQKAVKKYNMPDELLDIQL